MALSCFETMKGLGFECSLVGEGVLAVCTPISLPDQTPVYVYAREVGGTIELTDDGDTMMHLLGIGLFDNKRLASSVERRIAHHGGALEDGAVVVRCLQHQMQPAFESYLRALLEIIDYERELTAVGSEVASLINDVVAHLARRNPDARIEYDVTVAGTTGHTYRFPLKAGDTLIDTARPHHQSTGAILRKSADVEAVGHSRPLIIIDDRENLLGAQREAAIINSLASTMLFSALEHGSSPLQLLHH